ncbi:MAG: serine protease [Saprospiraceae bacterium]|nr:serine protease [Saprospiraceae bacterium]
MIDTKLLMSNLDVVKKVIDYFAAKYANPDEWEKIKTDAIENGKKFNSPNSEKFVNYGFLSPMDCTFYLSKNGFNNHTREIDETIKALHEKLIIYPIDKMLLSRFTDERYQFNGTNAYNLYKKNLILNILLGFEFIIKTFSNSVFKIEPTYSNGEKSIGTGFLIREKENLFIVTNKHVVQESRELKVYDINDNIIEYSLVFENPEKDIAIFELSITPQTRAFLMNTEFDLLDEVITIGYPSVPMTKLAYQLCHKGEINSIVQDYYDNSLIVFSAKTSSGNSAGQTH